MPGDQAVPLVPKLGLLSTSVQWAELLKLGRELTHSQNKGWFVGEVLDFGQVNGDRGFGQSAT